jgi:hypothetical protein
LRCLFTKVIFTTTSKIWSLTLTTRPPIHVGRSKACFNYSYNPSKSILIRWSVVFLQFRDIGQSRQFLKLYRGKIEVIRSLVHKYVIIFHSIRRLYILVKTTKNPVFFLVLIRYLFSLRRKSHNIFVTNWLKIIENY